MPHFSKISITSSTYFKPRRISKTKAAGLDYHHDVNNKVQITREERALVRKIDLMIMPIMCTITLLQFVNKTCLTIAASFGLKEELSLDDSQYNAACSIFYLGYLVAQFPNNYFLQRVPIAKYIGITVFLWGATSFCTGFVQNFSELMILRSILGLFEGSMYPAFTLLVSTFYRRREQAIRLGCVWLCNGLSPIVASPIGLAVEYMNDHGVSRWRWVLFIYGAITCIFGAIAFFFLIDNPKSKHWHLNAEKQIMVEDRTRDNAVVRTTVIKKDHIIEALKETRLWAFCIATLLFCLSNGGLCFYTLRIMESFGFTRRQSICLVIGLGACDIVLILLSVYIVSRLNQTLYVGCAMTIVSITGMILIIGLPVAKYRFIGIYLQSAIAATYVLMLASVSNNVSGYTKKIFYNGMMIVFFTIGNMIGPFVMTPKLGVRFQGSYAIYICANGLGLVMLLFARWRMALINRQRLARIPSAFTDVEDDLTDGQDHNFIYRL